MITKTATGLLLLTNKTDYYPFGSPMPNKTTTDGLYRYAFQGQELDPETGMEAFQLRLWDGRIGRWLTVDPMGQYASPYLGMGNNPITGIDPDGGDIIFLNDSKSVHGLGHAAVLIGNDKDGWRYLSMNGTSKNRGDAAKPVGDSYHADLGDIKGQNDFRVTGFTAKKVMKIVNTSNKKIISHHYDRAVRIKTSAIEDEIAYQAAKKQARGKTYCLFRSSCIDVPQQAFLSVVNKRLNESGDYFFRPSPNAMGFDGTIPNTWFHGFSGDFFIKNFMNVINNSINNDFDFDKIINPRDF